MTAHPHSDNHPTLAQFAESARELCVCIDSGADLEALRASLREFKSGLDMLLGAEPLDARDNAEAADWSKAEIPNGLFLASGMLYAKHDPTGPVRAASDEEFQLAHLRGIIKQYGLARVKSALQYIEQYPLPEVL